MMRTIFALAAALALTTPAFARVLPRHRHHHAMRRPPPTVATPQSRQNDCSNGDCRGINSSNGIGGSGGF